MAGITGGRGLAGTILIHKVAGAMAAAGRTLSEVCDAATRCASRVGTLGVALTTCTLPDGSASTRLDDINVYEV